jgi:hypothetical protein
MQCIEKFMRFLKANTISILVVLVFLCYTLISFSIYKERTLNGDIDNHILSGEMFGVPIDLKNRGIKPLFYGPGQTGWDGQFYYYMSNDVFALKDTASHIDSNAYRYQRIGLSLYAAIIAKILGFDWVSPTTFFISYLFLIIAATWAGARLFSKIGRHPALILFWSLSVGTQITLFNALPDAAADAFLILALSSVYVKRYTLSVIPFVFAALSREVYVLFPSFVLLFLLINLISAAWVSNNDCFTDFVGRLLKWKNYHWLVLPAMIAIVWHIYIVQHFGKSPSEQAHGVLGYPFVAWKDYFLLGINSNHQVVGTAGIFGYEEAGSLVFFLSILAIALWISSNILVKPYKLISAEIRGIAMALICFVFLYVSFGPTVMMHYTGYFKAIAVFFFLIPLLLVYTDVNRIKVVFVYLLLIVALSFTTFYNMNAKILAFTSSEDQYTKMSTITETRRIECFGKYEAKIKVNDIKVINVGDLSRLFGRGNLMVVNLDLINSGDHPFISTRNFGSVHMSYHWVDKHGEVVLDGIRSAIPGVLLPGKSTQVNIVSSIPKDVGELSLKLSPVQEGCSWFYLANPAISDHL